MQRTGEGRAEAPDRAAARSRSRGPQASREGLGLVPGLKVGAVPGADLHLDSIEVESQGRGLSFRLHGTHATAVMV